MKTILSPNRNTKVMSPAEDYDESLQSRRAPDFGQGVNRARRNHSRAFAPKTILVPLTITGNSDAILAIAGNLARESDARVVLLHVVQLNIAGEERGIQRARLINELCRDAEFQLRQLAGSMDDEVTTDVLVCEGRPAEAIVETARRLGADAIVMRTHGHRGWLKWLHRNTALKVMRQAPCKVWLVLPGKRVEIVSLMIVGQAQTCAHTESRVFHETQNPFRSFLRVLFS
jgi:nucleotide-binding universal stress UspA family protein